MTSPQAEVLIDVRERLARIETKLDHASERHEEVRTELAAHRIDTSASFDNHETRIAALEGRFKQLAAVGAVFMFVVTFLQDWIANRFL